MILRMTWYPISHLESRYENNPDLTINYEGRKSTVVYTYHTSGLHLATLQVVDNDGASTESLIVPIEIQNIDPQITPLAPHFPSLRILLYPYRKYD